MFAPLAMIHQSWDYIVEEFLYKHVQNAKIKNFWGSFIFLEILYDLLQPFSFISYPIFLVTFSWFTGFCWPRLGFKFSRVCMAFGFKQDFSSLCCHSQFFNVFYDLYGSQFSLLINYQFSAVSVQPSLKPVCGPNQLRGPQNKFGVRIMARFTFVNIFLSGWFDQKWNYARTSLSITMGLGRDISHLCWDWAEHKWLPVYPSTCLNFSKCIFRCFI